ncbi:molecular chaperone [Dunaliella salina]|uniref:Molecular chaperone n=1 Tax=Dunaliella salina TaxID=3046 RepID=A0ABQ7GIP0_DUNSA|nr:molecular chaperone [Dunaliella salina]|eukprot:KAF5834414.1 molecular chaperone [Dunaliella salina]
MEGKPEEQQQQKQEPQQPEQEASKEQHAREEEKAGPSEPKPKAQEPIDDDVLKAFWGELKDVDRDNEVNRILWAFKLNPYEKLNLPFDASLEDVRRQYRKISLMVHPDKCGHPQASTAFDLLGEAQRELMNDENRERLKQVLDMALENVRKERRKETKHDSLVRVKGLLSEAGREGVEAEWEKSDEFREKWKLKARELLANMEWRKRKVTKRLKDETSRVEAEEKEEKTKAKEKKKAEKEWEASRETRVGGWREFMTKKGSSKAVGELKPPKLHSNDEDRLFVQRPAREDELRPAQPPSMKPNLAKAHSHLQPPAKQQRRH